MGQLRSAQSSLLCSRVQYLVQVMGLLDPATALHDSLPSGQPEITDDTVLQSQAGVIAAVYLVAVDLWLH